MKDTTKAIIITGVGAGLGLAGIACFGYSIREIRSMRKMILGSAEKIGKMSRVDIDQRMVDSLVNQSVKEQAGAVARHAVDKIRSDYTADMKNRVKQILASRGDLIKKELAKEIADQISETDKETIMSDVTDKATELLVEKLSEDLENESGRISKIAKGIAAMLQ